MKQKKYMILFISFLLALISIASSNNRFDTDSDAIISQKKIAKLQDDPHPDWEDIIIEAYQSVGFENVKLYGSNRKNETYFLSIFNSNGDYHISISLPSNEWKWREDHRHEDFTFHGYPATIVSIRQSNGLDKKTIFWSMNGLIFFVQRFDPSSETSTLNDVKAMAEALYAAAAGGSPAPLAPQSPPSDACAGVFCQNNYCSQDGSKYLYDCSCVEGECMCRANDCASGCDADQGGCLVVSDLCSGVTCGPDYCDPDGETRLHDCKCDPADGLCACYQERCTAGCDFETGQCMESLVVLDEGDSSGENEFIFYDDSPDLLGTLGMIGGAVVGGGVVIGGGYLAFKGIQGALARRAVKTAATKVAEPSLGEMMARLEKTTERASRAADRAGKAVQAEQARYRDFQQRKVKYDEKWARHMNDRARHLEILETGTRYIKKGADMAADLIGNVPGVGNTFKYSYHLLTTATESAASGDSLGEIGLKTTKKYLETAVGDKISEGVTLLDDLPGDTIRKTLSGAVKEAGGKVQIGLETVKNEFYNEFINSAKQEALKIEKVKTFDTRLHKGASKLDRRTITKYVKQKLSGGH